MENGKKNLEKILSAMNNLCPFMLVAKSEISSRCACVLKCASLMNGGDPIGCMMHILNHTDIGKQVLLQITTNLKSLGLFLLNNFFFKFKIKKRR
jgi:hypothetical protein